jgi:DNA-binding NarL/FixJ family response regulator
MDSEITIGARVKVTADQRRFGAYATVHGSMRLRTGDTAEQAARNMVLDFPSLLTVQDKAVRPVWVDEPVITPVVSDEEAARIASLTEREREVLHILAEGARNQQIADRLTISVITVRHHLSSIFEKLKVGDRFEAAIFAIRTGVAVPVWLNARAYQRVVQS